jgi:hypothetical protein
MSMKKLDGSDHLNGASKKGTTQQSNAATAWSSKLTKVFTQSMT